MDNQENIVRLCAEKVMGWSRVEGGILTSPRWRSSTGAEFSMEWNPLTKAESTMMLIAVLALEYWGCQLSFIPPCDLHADGLVTCEFAFPKETKQGASATHHDFRRAVAIAALKIRGVWWANDSV